MKQFVLSLIVLTTLSFTTNAEQVLTGRAANEAAIGSNG